VSLRAMQFIRIIIAVSALASFAGCESHKRMVIPPIYYDALAGSVVSDANYGELIHAGKVDELDRLLEATLVQDAHVFGDSQWPDEHWRRQMLWRIELYYERTGKPVPPDLVKIFASIPLRPPTSCEIQQQKASKP